jgi:hypothetical protein
MGPNARKLSDWGRKSSVMKIKNWTLKSAEGSGGDSSPMAAPKGGVRPTYLVEALADLHGYYIFDGSNLS